MKHVFFKALVIILVIGLTITSSVYALDSGGENGINGEDTLSLSAPSANAYNIEARIGSPAFVDVISYSFGLTQGSNRTGAGLGTAKASFSDLKIVKAIDANSPDFMMKCARGDRLSYSDITIKDADGITVCKIKLDNSVISSFNQSVSSSGDIVEEINLRYSKITIEYCKGPRVTGSWNLTTNSP